MPLSRRLAERVSFGEHGHAPPCNAFLQSAELLPELTKTPAALGCALFHRDEHASVRAASVMTGLQGGVPGSGVVLDRSGLGQALSP